MTKAGVRDNMKSYTLPAIIAASVLALVTLLYTLMAPVTEEAPTTQLVEATPVTKAPEDTKQAVIVTEAEQSKDSDAPLPELIIDIARVQPDGMAVFAGKGAPNGTIFVTEAGQVLAQNGIDDNGQWVVLPEAPLSAGAHLLELEMITTDGRRVRADISLVVEISVTKDEKPLVAIVPQSDDETPRILQAPEELAIAEAPSSDVSEDAPLSANPEVTEEEAETVAALLGQEDIFIQIGSLSWRDEATLAVHGVASGGARVTGEIGNVALISADLPATGRWTVLADGNPFAAGPNQNLTIRLLDDEGDALATTSLMISQDQLRSGLDGSLMVVVHKGDALWRIAYRSYGRGVRYVDIFKRNQDKINDPDLIYPNQIFAVPGVEQPTNAPTE